MNNLKKMVLIYGSLLPPLAVKEKATIYHSGHITKTSPVLTIKEVSDTYILFETDNTIYKVSLEPKEERIALTVLPVRAYA